MGKNKKKQKAQTPANTKTSNKFWYVFPIGLLVVFILGFGIYYNNIDNVFIFDDKNNIVDNLKIRNLNKFDNFDDFKNRRFFGELSFAINYHFSDLEVQAYHLTNNIFHSLNAVLSVFLTILLLRTPNLRNSLNAKYRVWIALFAGLIFVSHPIQTQAVSYVVQRYASMMTTFYFSALIFYILARNQVGKNKNSVILNAIASAFFLFLAVYTKENSFTFFVIIALIEILFYVEDIRHPKVLKVLAGFAVLMFSAIIISIQFVDLSDHLRTKYGYASNELINSQNYFFTQISVLWKYIRLLFLPYGQMLDHDFPIVHSLLNGKSIASIFGHLALIASAVYAYKRKPILSFVIAWFYITLSIESSFIPIVDVAVEHRLYLPTYAFALMVSSTIIPAIWEKNRIVSIIFIVGLIGVYSVLTVQRNQVWVDKFSVWNDIVQKAPKKARGYNGRGIEWYRMGKHEKALRDFNAAIARNPNYVNALGNRGNMYLITGKFDSAMVDYNHAISLDSTYADGISNRALIHLNRGNYKKALKGFNRAIELKNNIADYYNNRGRTFLRLNKPAKAMKDFRYGLNINPYHKELLLNTIQTLYVNGKQDAAYKYYRKSRSWGIRFANHVEETFEGYFRNRK